MDISRRKLLSGLGASVAGMAICGPTLAFSGAVHANLLGMRSGSPEDQGRRLQSILETAARERKPVFLEPGHYRVSNVTLPDFVRLEGLAGATRLEFAGGGHFIRGQNGTYTAFKGIEFDGGLRAVRSEIEAAVHIANTQWVEIGNCRVTNCADTGIELVGSAGRVSDNRIDACVGVAGLLCQNSTGMDVRSNLVEACANNGILIHRWEKGEDNSTVTNNRIRHISAINGGTGPWGNGINTYLANGVIVAGNHVSDCAFSAIRSNSCNNIQISDNSCLRSGETAIYSEFSFQGAKITDNVVDGAATGISIANANEGGRLSICSGNLVRNLKLDIPYEDPDHERGIGIYAEADTAITGNVVETSPRFGIQLGWGPYLRNVVASANVVSRVQTGIGISVVDGIGAVRIDNNILSRISQHAIAGFHWHERVTGELALGGKSPLPEISLSGNRVNT